MTVCGRPPRVGCFAQGENGMSAVRSEVAGSVWKIQVAVGETVAQGDALVILESMKMEIPVEAPKGGTVLEIRVAEGDRVDEGTVVVTLG